MSVYCNYGFIFMFVCHLLCLGTGWQIFPKHSSQIDEFSMYDGIIISNFIAPQSSKDTETVTETEQQHSTSEANDEIPTSRRVQDRENRSVAWSARVFTFFILSCSLSQEMFVHNSGARNVIHLFLLWRRVLQNIDERQSVGETYV